MSLGIKVSIIVPVYNVSTYIERSLMSVMNQSYECLECVIVDDASQDDSIEKCKRMIANYNGSISFSVISHIVNKGLSGARNTGILASTGDYIFFLDGDDELTPDCIEKLIQPIKKDSRIEMVLGNVRYISENYPLPLSLKKSVVSKEKYLCTNSNVRDYFFSRKGYYSEAWNRLIYREFIIQNQLFFKEGIIWEASLWTFFLMRKLSYLYIVPDITYYYFKHPQTITTACSHEEQYRCRGIIYEEITKNFTICECEKEAKHYVRDFCRYYIHNSKDPSYQQSEQRFKVALKHVVFIKERCLLLMTRLLSKTQMGRKLFAVILLFRQYTKNLKL